MTGITVGFNMLDRNFVVIFKTSLEKIILQIVQYSVYNATNDTIKGWNSVTLFQICISNDNNRYSRWEIKIKINLEYPISHLLYQHITSLNLLNITFFSSIKMDKINKTGSIRD
jgi:hypothetical protein